MRLALEFFLAWVTLAHSVAPGQVQWTFPAGPGGSGTEIDNVAPVLMDGMVIFMSEYDHWTTYAVDARTGQLSWRFIPPPSNQLVCTSPGAVEGMVFFATTVYGATNVTLWGLDSAVGNVVWSVSVAASGVTAPPVVGEGLVYFGLSKLFAVNASNGNIKWVVGISSSQGSPAVFGGIVYLSSEDRGLYALDSQTGKLLWSAGGGGAYWGGPVVAEGLVFSLMTNSLVAFDALSGELRWRGSVSSYAPFVTVSDGRAFVSGATNVVDALNISTGQILWTTPSLAEVHLWSIPAVVNGQVFVGSDVDGQLLVLDALTGARVWNYTAGGAVRSPVVWDGSVYFGVNEPWDPDVPTQLVSLVAF